MEEYSWRIELLGGLTARWGDQAIRRFRRQDAGLLLAYLACFRQRPHTREQVIGTLWPAQDLEPGRNRLRIALMALRHLLEPPGFAPHSVLMANRLSVCLNAVAFSTDVADFEQALQRAAQAAEVTERTAALMQAVESYSGRLLEGYDADWIEGERVRLAEAYLVALHQLARDLVQARDLDRALHYAQRAVLADPMREEARLTLMRLYTAAGQPSAALRQYQELAHLLKEELHATPSAAARQFAEQLADKLGHDVGRESLTRTSPALAKPSAAPTSVSSSAVPLCPWPAPLTPFFGREEALAQLARLLRPQPGAGGSRAKSSNVAERSASVRSSPRLVTLTGPGGVGKTRLALETAERMRKVWQGRIWFVPLADLTEPHRLVDVIADMLGLPRAAQIAPLEAVVEALSGAGGLLILDNFEHLAAEGAPWAAALLERIPGLTLLVTSRRLLGLSGECEFAVAPLPTPTGPNTPQNLAQSASVQLFLDRVRAVRADFQITPENADAISALCHWLEGIPLALELAAARMRVLTPDQMLSHLIPRSEILVNRYAQKSARHRSLWSAIEWSYRLLSLELRQFFARLSVFRGSWNLEAAAAVCLERLEEVGTDTERTPVAEPREQAAALDYLEQLQTESLLIAQENGAEMRFRMLETLREFADAQLGEEARSQLSQRHALYFAALAEEADAQVEGEHAKFWIGRLDREHDNLRAALECALERCQADLALRLSVSLARYWKIAGRDREALEWLEKVLKICPEVPSVRLGRALAWAGYYASTVGDREQAQARHEAGLAVRRAIGDKPGIADSLNGLAILAFVRNDIPVAMPLWQESLALWREIGDTRQSARLLHNLAIGHENQGDLQQAQRIFEESLALWRTVGPCFGLLHSLQSLAGLALEAGEMARARAFVSEAFTLVQALGDKRSCPWLLERRALFLAAEGETHQAVRLLGSAEALGEVLTPPVKPNMDSRYKQFCDTLRAQLGEETFAAAWAEGRALPVEETLEAAFRSLDET